MDKKELEKILEEHIEWLENSDGAKRADLWRADLRRADLRGADLREADLRGADLWRADLRRADLREADLRGADLWRADLREADLSGVKGLPTAKEYLTQFEKNKKGVIVYKAIGDTYKDTPKYWRIEEGAFLEEVVNRVPTDECGCGVNFATKEWVEKEFGERDTELWECLIHWEDMADVVVPYNTDGKARCARLQLIKKI